ncbi:MAG: hydroxyacid dehydrogenase [Clostridiaceae bacterium]|nr:hydroxyacid dehydrogenase [Clostridiaceae bacterium]
MEQTKPKIKLAILMTGEMFRRAICPEELTFLETFAELVNKPPYPDRISEAYMQEHLAGAQACFTCWGTPVLSEAVLAHAPELKVILHGAGTPKAIVSEGVWLRGIRVATAAPVIAIDVAESALGGMIYCLKHFGDYDRLMRAGRWQKTAGSVSDVDALKPQLKRLNGRLTVGIVGASHVGRNMIRFLKPFGVRILLYDPTLSADMARELGVTQVCLETLMPGSDVVSVHAPQLPGTRGMITADLLASMPDGALFVNTSRGSIVDQKALLAELKSGRISAYLDVYEQEPLPADSELHTLDNVLLTPHVSGGHTVNGGFERGNYIVNQLYSYWQTGKLQHEALRDMLDTMA